MRKTTLTLALLASAGLAHATPADPAKSSVKFVFTQMNVPVEGQFKKFAADVAFDNAKLDASKVSIAVDLAAADAGSSDANQAMQMKEWFNTSAFPKATFTATQFKSLGAGKFQAIGQFALKGKTANLTVPFTVKPDAAKGQWFEGSFPLSRLAWKVGEGEWSDVGAVADAVQVKFKLYVPK
ncbi:YceI family protein [Chitinimonas taiwanensis]|uniref:Polyisoprenoid-binding protein YceI n=1 Tax=Chitinimonas taiwanensis DSM 18899 TaxID=1121279 RepID=A0A1K2HD16_9NEIS|nr:YceI family protein [Chitinimonas taiwanensis]SFZ74549.1 Polyisoprenoid-binding protein YceI [Chitinimonas taiwanensis DSM 18899]